MVASRQVNDSIAESCTYKMSNSGRGVQCNHFPGNANHAIAGGTEERRIETGHRELPFGSSGRNINHGDITRGGEVMKQLSESLDDLAARDKRVEESVTAAGEADRTALEKRRRQAEHAFEPAMDGIEAAVRDAGVIARERWNDTIASIARQIEMTRAARRRRQADRRVDRAMRAADQADHDAAATVALAACCANAAEYAVVDATLAGAEVNELTGQTSVCSEGVAGPGVSAPTYVAMAAPVLRTGSAR